MTTTLAPSRSAVASGDVEAGGALTGMGTLVRFMLRRDRVKLPAWVLGIVAFWLYYTRVVPTAYGTEEDLQSASGLVEGPMGRLWTGPGYGFEHLTYDRFIVGAYGLYILLLAALMSILLVVRHTRVEEQTGRAELVRANVVGRHAPLAAALVVATITNAAVAVAITAVTVSSPEMGPDGAALFGVGVGAVGLAFAGLAATTVQLTEFSRAAAGLAGGGLGTAFVIRALGDMLGEGGSALSWLSPLAWSQQTAPYVLDRWWPLALSVVFAAVTTTIAFRLSARRDVGASMFAVRPGPGEAPAWLGSSLTLALRLQRASIIGWTSSLAAAGLLFGAWSEEMLESLEDLPDTIIDVIGADVDVVDGYLGLMALFMALITAIYVILAVQSLRSEESSGRADPVLATPVSRRAWLGSQVAVTSFGTVVALGATGAGTGLAAAIATRDASHLWELTAAHLAYVPAVLLVLALASLLFGLAPKLLALAWVVPAYGLIIGMFGALMDAPSWAYDLSPFEHIPRMPLDGFEALPLVILLLAAALVALAGLAGLARRDLDAS